MTHHAPNCATRGLDLCDCQPVLAARATLTERALRRRRIDLSEIRTAIEFDECGLSVDPQYLRDWLRVQGISKAVAS